MIGLAIGVIGFLALAGIVIGVIYAIAKPTAPQTPPSPGTPAGGQGAGANNPPAPAGQSLSQKIASYVVAAVSIATIVLGLVWLGRPKALVVETPTPAAPVTTAYRHEVKGVAEAGCWRQESKVDWTKVKSTVAIPKDCRGYYLYNSRNEPFAIRLPDGEVLRSNNLNTNAPKRYLPLLPGKELKLASLTGKPVEISFHWN
jgi:hypothetical protein